MMQLLKTLAFLLYGASQRYTGTGVVIVILVFKHGYHTLMEQGILFIFKVREFKNNVEQF